MVDTPTSVQYVAGGGNDAVKVLLFLYNKLPLRVGRWYVATSRIASQKEWQCILFSS